MLRYIVRRLVGAVVVSLVLALLWGAVHRAAPGADTAPPRHYGGRAYP